MIVAQLTARRDYAVAKILESNGILTKLFTDAYYNPDTIPIFKILDKVLPKKTVNTYKRYQPDIPENKICYDWSTALKFRYRIRKNASDSKIFAQISAYKTINKHIIKYCTNNPEIDSYYGYDTACFEFFKWAKTRDFFLCLDQSVAPRKTQIEMYLSFSERYGNK